MPLSKVMELCDVESTRRFTPEGFLIVRVKPTRSGPIQYDAKELGVVGKRGKLTINRTDETVFHPDTMSSLMAAPITRNHPKGGVVTADNWRELTVGNYLGTPTRDNEYVASEAIIRDQKAIADIQSGRRRQLSVGYDMNWDQDEPGTGFFGTTRGPMEINHTALVPRGRAGPGAEVLDEDDEEDTEGEDFEMAITAEDIAKAVRDGISATNNNGGQATPEALASAIASAIKPIQDQLDTQETERKRLQDEQDAVAAKTKATADAKELERITRETTQTAERARAATISDAAPFITKDKMPSIQTADESEFLVAALGSRLNDEQKKDLSYMRGLLAGMKDQASRGQQFQQNGAIQGNDASPGGQGGNTFHALNDQLGLDPTRPQAAVDAFNKMVESQTKAHLVGRNSDGGDK